MNRRKLINQISKNEAGKLLERKSLFKKKKADKTELKWVDFYLLDVVVDPRMADPRSDRVVVDVLNGSFTFLQNLNSAGSKLSETTSNYEITSTDAIQIARREYTFHLLQRNLITKLSAEIKSISVIEIISYPFWIGYYVHSNHYTLNIVDGIDGRQQGGSLKSAIIKHLLKDLELSLPTDSKQPLLDTARSSNK